MRRDGWDAPFWRGSIRDWSHALHVFPSLSFNIVVTEEAGTEGREFGFYDNETQEIGLSPRLLHEPSHRQRGVLRHEIGHAVADQYGREELEAVLGALPDGEEKLADTVAAFIWGQPILYDDEAVQSTEEGTAGRPGFLHQ